ncbi:hypothetical protein GOHSU_14_01330 [Gordonia hirsuta DSM 44140 = NBRC 16056]|uniref:Coenzyme Q-binding protein COQ10 START domain-containing protein n=1 Tax=Gordonia hirsuta DSM 44140 = NBRC 16056 TaxID=1121927 RepID=L7L8B8_9ACTN|nr:SRPBCC family protein [Gordonia hirsuta]GAC56966.1 hypothetical protein GOHSU_14_01330 [Gordonia hirsuta DSM 44140 = NBRC 16056]
MAVSVSNEFDINAPLSVVMEVLQDVPALPDWSGPHSAAEVLTEYPDGTPDEVSITVGMVGINDTQKLKYTWTDTVCSWSLLESSQLAEQTGTYTLTEVAPDKTHVKFDLEIDLKIKLPGFLVKKGQKSAAETAKKGLTAEAERRFAQ